MAYEVAPILFEAEDAVTATASTELGTERRVGDKKFVYIYNGGSAEMTSKSPVSILTAAAGPHTCTVSTTAGHMVKGLTTVSIAASSYGWVLKEGPQTISVASGSSSLVVGPQQVGTDGVVKTLVAGGYPIGNLNTAVVSGNTGLLWVKIP
jgi:hypothetical protein